MVGLRAKAGKQVADVDLLGVDAWVSRPVIAQVCTCMAEPGTKVGPDLVQTCLVD